MTSRTDPWPNPVGWRVSAVVTGGLAHFFLAGVNNEKNPSALLTICGCCSWHRPPDRLFPERMARRRCKRCDRSAAKRGMQ